MRLETITAVAQRFTGSDGVLDAGVLEQASVAFELGAWGIGGPTNAVSVDALHDPEGKENCRGASRAPIEAEAVRQVLGIQSWKEYAGTFQQITFLGQTVRGRPLLLGRLQQAEAYLKRRFGISDGAALGAHLNIN